MSGPPLLRRGAWRIPHAEALVLAVHLHGVRRSRRPRLERQLRDITAPLLGYVLVGAAGAGPSADGAHDAARRERGGHDGERDEQQEERAVGRRL
jgi:hypothetical protein